jgi:hypothetical protein
MTTSTSVQYSPEIPDVLKPFYAGVGEVGKPGEAGYKPAVPGLIERGIGAIYPGGLTGQAAYQAQYAPVIQAGLMGAGSVAGLSPFQTSVGQQLGTMTTPGQYALGTQAGQAAAAGLQGLQDYQSMGVAAPQLTTYQLDPARQFSAAEAQAYMSPYMQSVVDRQQAAAIKAARESQLGQNLAAARQGTYGGARQTLLQGQRELGLQSTLADIQAKGLQSAFENAQAQFERDRAAQMGIGSQNLQAALGVQQLGAGQDLQAQLANQAAQQQAAQTRMGAAQGLGGLAGTFGQLGTQQLAGQLDLLKTQGAFGDLQRALQQQQMDAQRQSLIDQAQYGQTQVGQLSNLLRGIPTTAATQTTTTPPPSFASQLTGLGLTGIGLYNMLGGGKG